MGATGRRFSLKGIMPGSDDEFGAPTAAPPPNRMRNSALSNGTSDGTQAEQNAAHEAAARPGPLGGLRELANGLFHAQDAGLPLGDAIRVHRALPLTALALLISLAAAATFRALTPAPDPKLEWYSFGFLDERWLMFGYWLAVASALFVPLLATPRMAWTQCANTSGAEGARRQAFRVLGAVALYTLWLGPPWNLELLQRPMEWHEIVHLGPLQALLVGKAPYLESGSQYGPGLQLLSFHYLERFGVSLLHFREFWLWTHFLGGLVIVAWMAALFPVLPLLAGLLVFRTLSPFHFLTATDGGSYEFFFGWANCIRYAGAVHAILAVATVLARDRSADGSRERLFLFGSGVLWGLFVLISQENLGCGIAGLGILSGFALLSGASPLTRILTVLATFGAGCVAGLLPLLSLYAGSGQLGEFLHRYFEIGGYIVAGYSNTPFSEPWNSAAGILYRAVPVAAVLVFSVAAFDRDLARSRRFAMVGAAAAVLTCFAPALLRTASTHILAACTPVALLVAAAVAGLGRSRNSAGSRVVLAVALASIVIAFRPSDLQRVADDAAGRIRAFTAAREAVDVVPGRVGYRYDTSAPYSVFSEMPLAEFLDVGRRIRERVGTRPVVISSAIGTRGHWYFFADLHPYMADPEPSMTIVNSSLRARYLAELEVTGIPCLVSTRAVDTELAIFRAQTGERDEWVLPTSQQPFYVACMREPTGGVPVARAVSPR
jgi:hypothetical protein